MRRCKPGVAGLFCLLAAAAWAQSFLGSISGLVTDASGAGIPQAQVMLSETKTGVQRSVETSAGGEYQFADVPPGTYAVSVSARGFKELKSGEMILTGHQAQRFDARLEIGSTSETIEVAATAPTINTENAEIAGVQSREELITAPTNVRSTISLFFVNSYNYQGEGSSYSIGGLRGNNTNFTLDGTTSNSNIFGGQSGPQTEQSFESIRDMKFMASNNSAEFSNVATVFIESRAGENQFHGSAFYNQVNGLFNARSFFAATRPQGRPAQHQFGGSFGGPVLIPKLYNGRNKTFFYFTFEQNRFPSPAFNVANVPTTAFRSGDFSSLGNTVIDPMTGQAFPGGRIPVSRISPVATAVQNMFYPVPNTGASDNFTGNWGSYVSESDYTNRFTVRLDHQLRQGDNLSARMTLRNDPEPQLPDSDMATTYHHQYRRNINAYISETHLFTPTLLNEFRVGFSRDHSNITGGHDGSQVLSQIGLLGATPNKSTGVPEFDISNFSTISELPTQEWTSQALEILDNVSWSKGKHNLKIGVMVRHNTPNISNNPGCDFGCYSFDGTYTGFDYADFLLGIPVSTTRNFAAPNGYYRWNNVALYAQDAWKVTRKLTVTLGLRWEFNQPPTDKNNLRYAFNPSSGGIVVPNQDVLQFVSPLYPTTIPIQTAQAAGYPSGSLLNSNWHDFAPRVSFAYLPFARSTFVIRGGYGIFYSPLVGDLLGPYSGGPFGSTESFYNHVTDGVPLFSFPNPFGGSADIPAQTIDSFSKNLRTPYIQQWNLTVERELPGKLVARGTYRGFRSVQIPWTADWNTPRAGINPASEDSFLYPNFYSAAWTTNGGTQRLNAMDLSLERKFTSGFTFQSQYTLARNLSDTGNDGERATPENPYDRARDMGNISYMPRHRWVTTALYELPVGRGKRYLANLNQVANGVLGGWQLSGILLEQSGQFLDVTYSGFDILHNRQNSGRADCVADPYPANQSISGYYSRAAFAVPAPGMYGNCSRNAVTGPGMNNLNLGLQKNFSLSEKARLQFKATATNAFNHPIFSNPNTTITSGNFGKITGVLGQSSNRASLGAAGYRMIQLGARIDF